MDRVIFYFDPRCPWCYQTARWVRRLAELGEVDVDWRPFSLEVVNRPEGTDAADLEKTGSPALRTAVLLASECGSPALGPFYAALGRRTFEVAPPSSDQQATIRESLAEVGHDPELCDRALADPATWAAVIASTERVVERIGKLGVPTIALDDEDGPMIFGPVVSELPSDDDAVELWRHTAWLIRNDNFSELKRSRGRPPDLPVIRWYAEQRAAEVAAAAE
jgi:protein-disulfide isomerase-like protein with CxxC motif